MERDTWPLLLDRLSKLADRRPIRCQFTDHEIVRVFPWSVLHDRPVSWACDPRSWPGRRRRLPTPSTMTRRLRTLSVMLILRRLLPRREGAKLMSIDGKPLRVGRFSKDSEARWGYSSRGFDRGYKLHAACDRRGRLRAFDVRPMNEAECTVARRLVSRASSPGAVVLADAGYDSNPLHRAVSSRGMRLLAPRRKANRGLANGLEQSPGRLRSIKVLEGEDAKRRQVSRLRTSVERMFGWLTGIGGGSLPPWVRTLARVRRWIMAKLAILAAIAWP